MARLKKEHDCLKREPQPLKEFRPKNFEDDYRRKFDEMASSDEGSDSDSDSDGGKKGRNKGGDDDEWTSVGEDRQTIRTRERNEAKKAHYMKKYGKKLEAKKEAKLIEMTAQEENEDDIDDEEEGGEWINEENLAKHLTHGFAVPAAPSEREVGEKVKEGA